MAYQRVQRSYSDYDVDDIDIWFECIMLSVLETLHKYLIEIIDKTIYLFTEMNDDERSKKDELIDDELDEYCNQKRKERLGMLDKYFHCL